MLGFARLVRTKLADVLGSFTGLRVPLLRRSQPSIKGALL
jgi:hypothetical protein